MTRALLRHLANETDKLRQAGLYQTETVSSEPGKGAQDDAIDFTSNDYLGLSVRPEVTAAAVEAVRAHGHGLSAARPFGGTVALHHALEKKLAGFLGVGEAMVFASGYLANVGLFDALFDARDYVLADAAIHPSLAEGIRLCGARALPYRSEDLESLEDRLKRSRTARFRVVVTDGVFPLSGNVASMKGVCDLARRYDALVVVHDTLGVGLLGEAQKGSLELGGVSDRVDLVTGRFLEVLGGASGGYAAGRPEIIEWLRQKATPYLFGGAIQPADAGAALAAVEAIDRGQVPAAELLDRVQGFKGALKEQGFTVNGGAHAILTVGVGNVVMLQRMVNALSELGLLVQGMCYPVVPENQARIQLKITAAHTEAVLKAAVERLTQAAHTLQIL